MLIKQAMYRILSGHWNPITGVVNLLRLCLAWFWAMSITTFPNSSWAQFRS